MESKTRANIDVIIEEIAASRARLAACKIHDFGDFNDVPDSIKKELGMSQHKVECSKCKGKLPIAQIESYMYGVRAAGGDPHEVYRNYFRK